MRDDGDVSYAGAGPPGLTCFITGGGGGRFWEILGGWRLEFLYGS